MIIPPTRENTEPISPRAVITRIMLSRTELELRHDIVTTVAALDMAVWVIVIQVVEF